VLPLAGEVRAGFPSPAEEELRDLVSFDEYLLPRRESSFLAQARDDAMQGEGIRKGDLVILERGREPRHGDVVLAEADGAWVLRYFSREGGRVVLRAADPKSPPLAPRTELRLGGVVTAVVRKYHR
jgi:repressor LexA